MTAHRTETDVLVPSDPPTVELSNGITAAIKPLKARQFFALLRILTRGAGGVLPNIAAALFDAPERLVQQTIAVLIFAVPEAPDATFEFLREMVQLPDDPQQADSVRTLLTDPEMEDVVAVVEAVITAERDDLVSLGKRLRSAFSLAEKTGQMKTGTQTGESVPGPDSSTASPETTDGTTTTSSNSPSGDSSNSIEPSQDENDSKTSEPVST